MSTRGIIGKRTGEDEWYGVYHHFDSYPSGLGNCLVQMFVEEFNMNHEAMADYLIDEHPMGWSTLMSPKRACYCHRDAESHFSISDSDMRNQDSSNSDIEYLYLFGEEGIEVYQGSYMDSSSRLMLIPYNKADMFLDHAIV